MRHHCGVTVTKTLEVESFLFCRELGILTPLDQFMCPSKKEHDEDLGVTAHRQCGSVDLCWKLEALITC